MEFSVFEHRIERIRQYLAERDLQALLMFQPPNIGYVSGLGMHARLPSMSMERPWAAIIPLEENPALILCEHSLLHPVALAKCWIKDQRFFLEHPRLVNRMEIIFQWEKLFCRVLNEKNIFKGRVGVDRKVNERIKEFLPEVSFVDASELLREMRLIKCKEELDLFRKAGEITDVGMKKLMEEIGIGRYKCEVGTEAARLVAVEVAKRHPQYSTSFRAFLFPGVTYEAGKKLKNGDVVMGGVFVTLNGYEAENERTFIIGEPTEKQRKIFNVMVEAQRKGIEAAVSGNQISDIDAAAQKVIEKAEYGDYIRHRTGHGSGLQLHEYPHDMPFNHRLLIPGMVFSCEPGIYVPGVGDFRHSDHIIITEDVAEPINKFPKDLKSLLILP